MKRLFTILVVVDIFIFTGYAYFINSPTNTLSTTPIPEIEPTIVTKQELEAGQLFMIGHWTNTPVASTTELIKNYGFGGVVIMDAPQNPLEIKAWVKEWNGVSKVPLIIAIDQEGGPVTRLKGENFVQTGQREITNEKQAFDIGSKRGKELAALGINMNFAPVMDTSRIPTSFMYGRTFSNLNTSPTLAAAMIKGMASAGVVAAPKHFPGHDDTTTDSHEELPVLDIDRATLDTFTAPFRILLANDPPQAIMTAHVLFPKIDNVPATLSKFFLTTYLRDTLKYKNVIITDDMIMDSIDLKWSSAEATVMSLRAGADMILFAAEPTKAFEALEAVKAAANKDPALKEKLNLSTVRVNKLRN